MTWFTLDDTETPIPLSTYPANHHELWPPMKDTIQGDGIHAEVSTVFLSLDHSFDQGTPVLWETMIFGGGDLDESTWRYTSADDARKGHESATRVVEQFFTYLRENADEINAAEAVLRKVKNTACELAERSPEGARR